MRTLPKLPLSWPHDAPPRQRPMKPKARARARAKVKARAATMAKVAVKARRMHLHPVTNLAARRLRPHPVTVALAHPGVRGRQLLLRLLHHRAGIVLAKNADVPLAGVEPLRNLAVKRSKVERWTVKPRATRLAPPRIKPSIKKERRCSRSGKSSMIAIWPSNARRKSSSVRLKLNVLTAVTVHNAERHPRTYVSSCRWKNL